MQRGLLRASSRALSVRLGASAYVDATAYVHETAQLAPGAIVLARAHVDRHCELRAGSIVGPGARIGEGTIVGMHTSVENCTIGAHCILHSGVRIGADGFGFAVDADGSVRKKPQLRQVLIGNEVEIGAGSCIDRGSWRDTCVGDQTKIDNLVQVGHNVLIGRGSLICAHGARSEAGTMEDTAPRGFGAQDRRTLGGSSELVTGS